jgi:predicted AAA+ superfamily ATPase
LARSLGVSEHTVRHYLDVLTGTFLLRQLPPWYANISKRQVKAPKVYIRDSGLLHALLVLSRWEELEGHPKFGASWEGFALEQVLGVIGAEQAFYWATHAGAELDLVFFRGGRAYGMEFKTSDAPTMTKSLHVALTDLELERAWIVYPGTETYQVHERVEVTSLARILKLLAR